MAYEIWIQNLLCTVTIYIYIYQRGKAWIKEKQMHVSESLKPDTHGYVHIRRGKHWTTIWQIHVSEVPESRYIWIYAGKGESIVSQPHICENLKDSMTHHRKPMCMPKSNWGNNHTWVWFNEGHISVYMYVNRIKTMSQGHKHIFEYEIRIKAMKQDLTRVCIWIKIMNQSHMYTYKYEFRVKTWNKGYIYIYIESRSKQWAKTTGPYMSMEFRLKQWNSK